MATDVHQVLMTGDTGTESFYGVFLTGGAFNFIGVKPILGRTIQPYDIPAGGKPNPVVVLTYGLWRRLFNGDAHVLGTTLILDGVPHIVIGVMPSRFGWWTNEAFWLPMPMDLSDDTPINAIMRLVPGIKKEIGEQQLNELNVHLAQLNPREFPKGQMHTVLLNYMGITQAGGAMKSSLNLLLAGGLSFISACKIRQCARPAMPTDNSPGFWSRGRVTAHPSLDRLGKSRPQRTRSFGCFNAKLDHTW
jgi:putative ABC transport system permease protein